MYAGESLIKGPALGSLRLVRDVVVSCMDPDDQRPGLLVQEYEEDGDDRHRDQRRFREAPSFTPAIRGRSEGIRGSQHPSEHHHVPPLSSRRMRRRGDIG